MAKRKVYTKEFKLDAVNLVLTQGYGVVEAARSLGLSTGMLSRWVKEHRHNPEESFRGNGTLSAEQEQIKALKAKVARLEQEKEILKKAATFFAAETK